jgi:thiamine-monophosphate kinase
VAEPARRHLVERYRLPQPRLALGQALRGLAHAAIDISDGLVADLGHVALASDLAASVRADLLPLSVASDLPGAREAALAGGDDYELLFTVAPGRRDAIAKLARDLALPLTRIGQMQAGSGVRVIGADGAEVEVARTGWQHF